MTFRTSKKESAFQAKVKKYARSKGYVITIWGGGFQEAGIPDTLMCINGRFIGLELKVGDNRPSPIQLDHIREINESGLGIGAVVWDWESAKLIIDYAANTQDHLYPDKMDELRNTTKDQWAKYWEKNRR